MAVSSASGRPKKLRRSTYPNASERLSGANSFDIFSCSNARAHNSPLRVAIRRVEMPAWIHAFVEDAGNFDQTRSRRAIEEDVYGRGDQRLAAFFAGVAV
jgi:hypothetical protein